MPVHDSRLVRSETVAEGTMAFRFERPQGFVHQAGQNITLSLVDPPETDAKGPSRTFTIASAPHESTLMIATRMRDSAFKRVLKGAAPGLRVKIDGPDGFMTMPQKADRPLAFLAGGIGITPFLSMARDAAARKLPHRITLFYSNRRPEDAAFLDELQRLERDDPNLRLIATMTEPDKSAHAWSGETGFIRRELLERHLPDLGVPVYYLAGPPAMTMAMQSMLGECGVAETDVLFEEFYGY
jgi:ferredoxin-NADP reductase